MLSSGSKLSKEFTSHMKGTAIMAGGLVTIASLPASSQKTEY
jgi:hypothetical protein